MEHTQGTWKTTYKYEVGINHSFNPFKDNVQTIAFCDPEFSYAGDSRTLQEKEKEAEANANFIVTACNLHNELIEALKECKDYFDYMKGENHVSSRPAREKTNKVLTLLNKADIK